jgi:hypothetical protein
MFVKGEREGSYALKDSSKPLEHEVHFFKVTQIQTLTFWNIEVLNLKPEVVDYIIS